MNNTKENILITTGVYPPQLGGPAKYAVNLEKEFKKLGHRVIVKSYNVEHKLPIVIRHLYFMFKILPSVLWADRVITLDTLSTGVPTVFLTWIFRKKSIVRIGGDFLWEAYTERTQTRVKLINFYGTDFSRINIKEKIIFYLTSWMLQKVSHLVFNTKWQYEIWKDPYNLHDKDVNIITNYLGPRIQSEDPKEKNFLWAVRPIFFKNRQYVYNVFKKTSKEAILDSDRVPHDQLMEKIRTCYAVILPSVSDISPNYIFEAVMRGKPFIMTRETGFYEEFKDIGIFVDPFDEEDCVKKTEMLLDPENYKKYSDKVRGYAKIHDWKDISAKFLEI